MSDLRIKSLRQIRSEQRIQSAANRKRQKNYLFHIKLAARRGWKLEEAGCMLGVAHVVGAVQKAGQGWFYKSWTCSGCSVGDTYFKETIDSTLITHVALEDAPQSACSAAERVVLYSKEEVKPGDIVVGQTFLKQA